MVVGIGTGFTGRRALGQKPLRWADMPHHVDTLRALLRGETVEVEGRATKMLHWAGQAPGRPIEVPIVLGVNGPRGLEVAKDLGCGVFTSRPRPGARYEGYPSVTLLGFGTVLDDGEPLDSARVMAAAGPPMAVAYHAFLEQRDARLDSLPNAATFVELAETLPEDQRHLHIHEGHLTRLNAIDRQVMTPEAVAMAPLVGTAAEVKGKLAALEAAGITEVAFQPAGDDLARELRAMAAAAGLRG